MSVVNVADREIGSPVPAQRLTQGVQAPLRSTVRWVRLRPTTTGIAIRTGRQTSQSPLPNRVFKQGIDQLVDLRGTQARDDLSAEQLVVRPEIVGVEYVEDGQEVPHAGDGALTDDLVRDLGGGA